jgi:site-specific recombinase
VTGGPTASAPGSASATPIPPALTSFCDATDTLARLDAFAELIGAFRDGDARAVKDGPLARLIGTLEASEEWRRRLGETLAALLAETDATNLIGCTGIPGHRGFFAEFGDRLSARVVPVPRDERDLAELAQRLYRSEQDVAHVREMPLDLWHRFVRIVDASVPADGWLPLRAACTDGFRLLLARIENEGLSPKVRARGTKGSVFGSPFTRIRMAGEEVLARWTDGGDVAAAIVRFKKVSGECRKECRAVEQHLEAAGVNVDIVFSLEVIDRCLTRTALMTDIFEPPTGPVRSRAIQRLLARLLVLAQQDRSLWHLVSWNLHLMVRKIVDRSGETGDHYIAKDRHEYRHVWLAAAGGGLLTVGTALVKAAIHTWHLPAMPEGLLYGLNYAVSFLALQHLGLILATKQPAMTAARFAGIIRECDGDDREEQVASTFARLVSSQLAAAVGNVLMVAAGSLVAANVFFAAAHHAYLDELDAVATLKSFSPVHSMTAWYAALTGVVLWIASIVGGWFDNWCVYHEIPAGIEQHALGRRLGRERMRRWARAVTRHASGWGTNVSLGLMLGMMPAIGRFTGLPFDVRHVTLNSGILALAAGGLEGPQRGMGLLLWAVGGIATMFVLNLSVSFACSLWSAAKAYELTGQDIRGLWRGIGQRILRRPLDFIRGPRS